MDLIVLAWDEVFNKSMFAGFFRTDNFNSFPPLYCPIRPLIGGSY